MSQTTPTSIKVPDSEVVPGAKRRQFAAEYKLHILEEADNYTEHGQGGLLPLAVSSQSDPCWAVDPDSGIGRGARAQVDHYILDFARVYFATAQRGMAIAETTFAVQRPRYLVEEYARMIEEFGLDGQMVYDRAGVGMAVRDDKIEPSLAEDACQNERREQEEPIAGGPTPAFPLG